MRHLRDATLMALTYALLSSCAQPTTHAPVASPDAPGTVQAPAQATPTPVARQTIYIEGDSTMYGSHHGERNGGVQDQTLYNPPAILNAYLALAYGVGQVVTENHAEPGSTLANSLNGENLYGDTFDNRMAASSATIVINNSALNDDNATLPLDVYKAQLEQWIATVRKYNKIPVLEEPNPATCNFTTPLSDYVNVQRTVAQEQGVTLIAQYDSILATVGWQQQLQDCEHPLDVLYEFKAHNEATTLIKLINEGEH